MKKSITLATGLVVLFFSLNTFAQGWKWAKGSSCPNVDCEGFSVAVDKKGNSFAIGTVMAVGSSTPSVVKTVFGPYTIIDSGSYANQGVIVSLDSTGHYRWALGTQNGRVWLSSIKSDDSGNVYVLGDVTTSGGFNIGNYYYSSSGLFIMKMDGSGAVAWIKPVPYGTQDYAISHGGSIFLSGANIFYAKYDRYLNPVWTYNLTADTTLYLGGIDISADSQIYITGMFYSDTFTIGTTTLHKNPSRDRAAVFLAKFDASGSPIWAKSPYSDSTLFVTGVAVDPGNNAYITGSYHGPLGFASDSLYMPGFLGATFTLKYDATGNPKWARSVTEPNFYKPSDIAADKCGNVWVAGNMPFNILSDSMFLIHFDTLGHIFDTVKVSSGGDDQIGIALDEKGNLFVCGDYYNKTYFGGTVLPKDSSDEAMFVAKYRYGFPDCTRDTIPFITNSGVPVSQLKSEPVAVYPNPNTGTFTITGEAEFIENAAADLFDISGRSVFHYQQLHDKVQVNMDDLAPGLYQLRVSSVTGRAQTIKVVVIK